MPLFYLQGGMKMAKSATIKDNKWVGTIFENEDLVDLMIPLDPLNKSKHMFVCINGQEVYVARGMKTKVPACVAELVNRSLQEKQEAELAMENQSQINY